MLAGMPGMPGIHESAAGSARGAFFMALSPVSVEFPCERIFARIKVEYAIRTPKLHGKV